ncbi:MAG TPA: hypothetical protein PLL64_00650 [Rhodothermales bacterium]|nr:hypothetical protein [Bacteroidota bacterium]HRK72753.1 hypothetical protein [Rhodothermales bacterium]HRR07232.1 hypothetical protein [Rhodothermales bacterium]
MKTIFALLLACGSYTVGYAQPINLSFLLAEMYDGNSPYSPDHVVFSKQWTTGKGENKTEYAVIAVKTSESDCHACAARLDGALFRKDRYTEGGWQRSRFRRDFAVTGGFNEPGEISLMKLSDDEYGIRIDAGYTGQGYTVTGTAIFYPEMEFERIAAFQTSEDNSGACDPPERKCFGYSTKITTVSGQKEPETGFYDLKLVISGTNSDFKLMNRTLYYRYNGLVYDRK